MKKTLYRLWQLCIAAPLIILATVITSLVTCIGCFIGSAHVWGYYPGKYWSIFVCHILLLPVKVEGRDHLDSHTSYIFVINHQSAMDIFLIYGFLRRNFKWMMKKELRRVPFVGIACQKARHIFVDRSSPRKTKETIDRARATLKNGTSLVVFPEGSRTYTGRLGRFKKGAYLLADELQLPVVPITITGPFEVLPRTKGINFVAHHPMHMIIHAPIQPQGKGRTDIQELMDKSRNIILQDLPPQYRDSWALPAGRLTVEKDKKTDFT